MIFVVNYCTQIRQTYEDNLQVFNTIVTDCTDKPIILNAIKEVKRICYRYICGDLGINGKTPNRILTRRLPDTKCINASPRIRLHASIRLKSEKRK